MVDSCQQCSQNQTLIDVGTFADNLLLTVVKLTLQQKSQRSVGRGYDKRAENYSQLEVAEMNIQLLIFASLFLCTFAAYGGSYGK